MKNALKKTGFAAASALTLLLMSAVLELNKNTLWGWAAAAAVTVCFFLLHHTAAKRGAGIGKALCWLVWLALFVLILALSWPPVRAVPAVPGKNGGPTGIVSLRDGDVQGVLTADGAVEVYAGIPYAAPPVGELRWREPQDPRPGRACSGRTASRP